MEKVKQVHLHENTEVSKLRESCNRECNGWNKIYTTKNNREAKQCGSVMFHLEHVYTALSFYFTNLNHPYTCFYFVLEFILTFHHLKCLQRNRDYKYQGIEIINISDRELQNQSFGMQKQIMSCTSTELGFQICNSTDNWTDLLNGQFLPPNHCFL